MIKEPFNRFNVFLFDGDGVLYKEEEIMVGVLELLNELRREEKKIYILTNNSTKTRVQFKEKIENIGIKIPVDNILTSAYLTSRVIASEKPGASIYVIGEQGLKDELKEAGLIVVNDWEEKNDEDAFDFDFSNVDYVVTGMDRQLTYVKLARAMNILQNSSVRFIGTNADITFPTPRGYIPGGGAMIAILEHLSSRKIDRIIGKPQPLMFQMAEKLSGVSKERMIMIGDRLETDILGANRAGITSCLVLTGASNLKDVSQCNEEHKPDIIINTLLDMLE